MPVIRFTIKGLGNFQEYVKDLEKISQKLERQGFKDELQGAAGVVAEGYRRLFEGEGAYGGSPAWVSLSGRIGGGEDQPGAKGKGTVWQRQQHTGYYKAGPKFAEESWRGPEHKILHWTGRLRNSLTRTDNQEENITEILKTRLKFGTKVPYAVYHDEGKGNNPQRRLWSDQILRDLEAYWEGVANEIGNAIDRAPLGWGTIAGIRMKVGPKNVFIPKGPHAGTWERR